MPPHPPSRSLQAESPLSDNVISTEVVIVGAGPAGLFQVFELGLLGIKAHVLDTLKQPGGQCSELYPDKPIYDIPALPVCGAQELVDRLLQQIKPFGAGFHYGEEATQFSRKADGRFRLVSSAGTEFDAGAVVIAAGVGSFQPRRLGVEGIEALEGTHIHYKVTSASAFHGRRLAIFGGGDSALDWVMALAPQASGLTLVHRRAEFRAQPASVAKMRELEAAGRVHFIEGLAQSVSQSEGRLSGVLVKGHDGREHAIEAEQLLVFFGLAPKLGPIAEWGLHLDKRAIVVDTEKFQSNIPGVFAIGDINTYPGKKKLILSGFHEAALAAFAVQAHLYPGKKQFLQYTTTSPAMQKRLGVTGA
ncbi:MAG: NAD(P)/FAD-dependent oxidoreductase [Gammaproteobacteria bacterium]|nr:NAD(P)/FAD-dependent oxidoreductase [Gammaproteobacteria bacterium]